MIDNDKTRLQIQEAIVQGQDILHKSPRSPGCYTSSELDSKRLDWLLKNVVFSELIEILDIDYGATLQDRKAAIDRKMGI